MCDSPYYVPMANSVEKHGHEEKIPVGCGRCPTCRRAKINGWVFRLLQEEKRCTNSHFITLTYEPETVPVIDNLMTLRKKDFQNFMKRLRWNLGKNHPKIKYYAVGEYGSKSYRPHYHAIIFNVNDASEFAKAWTTDKGDPIGYVDVGNVSGASITYTLKYMDKQKRVPRWAGDPRLPEFTLSSKGLGENYLTPEIIKYHKDDLTRQYVTAPSGHKIPIPKYYKDKIFTDEEKYEIQRLARENADKLDGQLQDKFFEHYKTDDHNAFILWLDGQKEGRYYNFVKNKSNERDKI